MIWNTRYSFKIICFSILYNQMQVLTEILSNWTISIIFVHEQIKFTNENENFNLVWGDNWHCQIVVTHIHWPVGSEWFSSCRTLRSDSLDKTWSYHRISSTVGRRRPWTEAVKSCTCSISLLVSSVKVRPGLKVEIILAYTIADSLNFCIACVV